ncbi:MAG: Tim44/TimA family putative adaptor protein [Alphaproteobacteria bacterium]|nr:MAG: Tim44/TimA family putative adaptor protein [Alphaproteobacteria bacterium]
MGDETYRSFEAAIAAREAAGETMKSEIRSIEQASIEAAALTGTIGTITVKFVSDQVSETLDKDGRPVHGTDAVTEITDIWTFERDLAQPDPAWRMTEARSG